MIFLINYDRQRGLLVKLQSFKDAERTFAEEARLELDLANNRRAIANEVVILEAADEAALRKTHRRYFENLEELAKSAG